MAIDDDDFLALPDDPEVLEQKRKDIQLELFSRVGRPLIMETPEEFQRLASEYFQRCIDAQEKLTITGLALWCGLSSLASLWEYEQRPAFSEVVKAAKLIVTNGYEQMASTPGMQAAGPIFILKNLGWTDQQAVSLTGAKGGPVQTEEVNQQVAGMNDIEKATRLYHILRAAQQAADSEEDEDIDPLS